MPWIAKVVGYVDRLGYLWCSECVEDDTLSERLKGLGAVRADAGPHNEEPCERCGVRLLDQPGALDKVQIP